ncbi:MAG: L-asparaginase, partial [Burkholderiaceae bacterium]
FADICDALLPDYGYSLGCDRPQAAMPASLPVIPLRANLPPYAGAALPWPPGWSALWSGLRPLLTRSEPVRFDL